MKGLIITLIFLIVISCSPRHTAYLTEKKCNTVTGMKIKTLPDTIRFSNNFRMLWDELQKETGGDLYQTDYIPSEQLKKKYNLKYSGGKYYIKGYMHTRPDFDNRNAEKQGISIVSYTDTLKSFSCPIFYIPELIALPNILIIELSKSVKLK